VQTWLAFAREDLEAAKHVMYVSARNACFLAQQAAEKALKAVLVREQVPFPKTHHLEQLRLLLPEALGRRLEEEDFSGLTSWAVASRYPDEWDEPGVRDVRRAMEQAMRVFAACEEAIGEAG